jgi:tetratricopeptide (TPR) repeat protein
LRDTARAVRLQAAWILPAERRRLLLPGYVAAYISLADLYHAQQREADTERTLRQGIAVAPGTAVLHYVLGMSMARVGRTSEAVLGLERAVALAPEDVRVLDRHAIALHSTGMVGEAIRTLEEVLQRHPADRESLFALATFDADSGIRTEVLRYADLLLQINPDDPQVQALRKSLAPPVE